MSLNTAEQLEENGQYDKAYEEYKKLYAQNPKSIEVLEKLGHVAMILNNKAAATDYYNQILELDKTSILAYEQLMDIYVHSDRYKYYISRGNLHVVQEEFSHAINDFKKALDKAESPEQMNSARFVLASLYEQVGKNHQAIDEYLRILDTKMVNEIVYLKLAQVYINENAVSSAIEILERARENNLDTNNIKENLAQLYLKNNQPEKARLLSENDLIKIKSLLEEDKNQEAFEILNEVKDKYKKNSQYYLLLAQYYFNTRTWDKSLENVGFFEQFEKMSPLVFQMRALIYEEKCDEFNAHINWAKYYLTRKEKDIALNEYLSAYQLDDQNTDLILSIAELIEDLNDKNHAAEFWEKLICIEPNNKRALEKLADFRESIGDYKSQLEVLEKLYDINKKNTVVIAKLAKTYEKIKNKEKSLEFYNKFVSLSPINDEHERIKAKIKKLESSEMEEDEGLIEKIMRFFNRN